MSISKTKMIIGVGLLWQLSSAVAVAGPLPGAIFTTLVDGSSVNANIYQAKEDVYLDGGPGQNAPAFAAGLPAGQYFFQVTDPSGKTLLSQDPVKCRKFEVSEDGVITQVIPANAILSLSGGKKGGKKSVSSTELTEEACQHMTGIDQDHAELGAITVQLMPYEDTPNNGGVYKVWVTPMDKFEGDPEQVDNPGMFHGFIPSWSKTDNYKVKKRGRDFPPGMLTVRKFHDKNLNGVQDEGEVDIAGWPVDITDPLAIVNSVFTPVIDYITSPAGTWMVTEDQLANTLQTVSILDGNVVSLYPTATPKVNVEVAGTADENHEVVFGNVGLGKITACKFYDRNGNKHFDYDEPKIPGWKIKLTGEDLFWNPVGPIIKKTGEDGCVMFTDLLPGKYTVTEVIAGTGDYDSQWIAKTPTSGMFQVDSTVNQEGMIAGSMHTIKFGNVCISKADFDTKGYWHNKNGLSEITEADIAYVNGLSPYSSPSSYFDDGDEPFDGMFTNGDPVPSSLGGAGEELAPAGSTLAEISQFLVDPNAGGDPREQLAQQLLAFIFNSLHNLNSQQDLIQLPDGNYASAASLIDKAILVWESGTSTSRNMYAMLLDQLNNNDAIRVIGGEPCDVVYGGYH